MARPLRRASEWIGAAQQLSEYPVRERPRFGAAAGPWPRHVQDAHLMLLNEHAQLSYGHFHSAAADVDHQAWLALAFAALQRRERAAREGWSIEDHRGVGVTQVAQSALPVAGGWKLHDRVAVRNAAILCKPTGRAPTTAGKPRIYRSVEPSAIDARLAAGGDPCERRGRIHPPQYAAPCSLALGVRPPAPN